jgi:hypothetical protein
MGSANLVAVVQDAEYLVEHLPARR